MVAKKADLSSSDALARLKATALARSTTQCPKPCGAGLLNAFAPTMAVDLSPPALELTRGGSATLTVTVTKEGAPQASETVALQSNDPAIASIEPPSAVTDASGKTTATVKGLSAGETRVKAAAPEGSKEAPVKVPAMSSAGFVLLAAIVLFLAYRRRVTAA
jgi:serine protease